MHTSLSIRTSSSDKSQLLWENPYFAACLRLCESSGCSWSQQSSERQKPKTSPVRSIWLEQLLSLNNWQPPYKLLNKTSQLLPLVLYIQHQNRAPKRGSNMVLYDYIFICSPAFILLREHSMWKSSRGGHVCSTAFNHYFHKHTLSATKWVSPFFLWCSKKEKQYLPAHICFSL